MTEQLDALTREDPPFSWEVIVSDNGSNDGSVEVARSYAGRLPLEVVDSSSRSGASAARNIGVEACRASRLVFLDADDVIAPGYLERMDAAIREHGLVAARMNSVTINPDWAAKAVRASVEVALAQGPYAGAPTATLGTIRELFDSIGGFDESFSSSEDIDFCWRVQQANPVTLIMCDAVLHYRLRSGPLGLFRQARVHACGDALLYQRWRSHGLGRSSVHLVLRRWIATLGHLALSWRGKTHLARGMFLAGICFGRIEGSIKHRVVYL